MKHSKLIFIFTLAVIMSANVYAQESSIKFYGSMQLWSRYTSLNPGSTINGVAEEHTWDFSVRRYRIGVKGSVSENMRYNLQLGNNNLNRYNKDVTPKLLDAYIEYDVNKFLTIAAGKHAFVGLTRWASPSTLSAMGTDTNYAGTPFLNQQDDFFRRLGVAFKGQIGKVDYRFVVAKPFSVNESALSSQAQFINDANSIHTSGYVKYQFLDKESQSSAFAPWTYLGSKQIFNIGAGFWYQTNSTGSIDTFGDTLTHHAVSFAADVLYERTHATGNTWTFSAAFIHHELGPDFIRNIGANNAASGANGSSSFNGRGNSFPATGSGDILLAYVGFLKPFNDEKGKKVGLQPYLIMEYGLFEVLDEPSTLYEGGFNYLLNGHNSKLTLGYQHRPIFVTEGDQIVSDHHEGMVVLQYEVKFK